DTDAFQPIIQAIATLAGVRYGDDKKKDIAIRVIADHIRTIAFAITDGQLPSNAKAGYVIRRILRRAVRYGYTFLGRREAFLYRLLPVLIETMGDAYPELIAQKELIKNVMKEEEDAFLRTLDTGIRLLDKCIEDTRKTGHTQMDGKTAFTLYDTYGFPLDLTELIVRENQMTVDVKQFDVEMKKQKERARNAAVIETGDWITLKEGKSEFVGYDLFHCDCEILRYRQIKQKKKTLYQVVLDKTPFYAEMGGQVGDSGWLINDQEKVEVIDVKRENNLPVHILKKLPQDLTASFTAQINEQKRIQSECNHSATHLLHKALRLTLGEHVEQKGSFVSPDALRFDFSHFQKVSAEELRHVECLINEMIRADYSLEEHRSVPIVEAQQMGAIALFGEKYGEEVRVIKYGDSIELCGGTHIPSTGRIGSLRIISESSVAAGVRRIEAVTAGNADHIYYKQQDFLADIRALFNNVPDLKQTLVKAIDENAELKKQLAVVEKEKALQLKKKIQAEVTERNGIKKFVYMGQARPNDIKDIAFQIKGETQEDFIFVAGTLTLDKCQLTVMLSEGLIEQGLHAGKMVKTAATHIKGGGGGQPHFATAGGKDPKGISAAINTVLETAGLL
ncbi:MAG: alanine--tRNA ligase, partial [Massilibacteroides sp.]|nr:alanine--tRNA ligase [Massilibacteroides sp.]